MDFIISLFLGIIYFFIETNAYSGRHYFQLYILFLTLLAENIDSLRVPVSHNPWLVGFPFPNQL